MTEYAMPYLLFIYLPIYVMGYCEKKTTWLWYSDMYDSFIIHTTLNLTWWEIGMTLKRAWRSSAEDCNPLVYTLDLIKYSTSKSILPRNHQTNW